MNKTISINIGGFVFNIEENAYQKLYHYLSTIKKNFTEVEEREEIMGDIEARIAEIFQTKLSAGKEVITEKDVENVIDIMGKPEDYVSDEFANSDAKSSTQKEKSAEQTTSTRRLFRDSENAMLGGVCSGLSHYFNIDIAIVRTLFIVFTILGGSGILIYIILLVAVPEAKTTNDKLHMRGQSINLESIKEHFTKIKDDIKSNTKNSKIKNAFNQTIDKGVQVGSTFVRAFSKIIGLAFVIGGIFALVLAVTVLFGNSGLLPMVASENIEDLPTLLSLLYPGETQSTLVFFSMIFVLLIPIISLIVVGTKVLFNYKKSFKTIAISSTILWFICAGILVITGIDLGMNMRSDTSIEYEIPYTDSSDVLFIDVSEDNKFSNHIAFDDVWNHSELVRVENENIFLGYPELVIKERQDSGNFEIILYKQSHGMSNKDAINKAERIDYKINLTGNRLLLPPYFSIPKADKLRVQRPVIEVRVPKGKRIELGKNIDRIELSVSGQHNYYDDSFSNTTWVVTGEQLICLECKTVSPLSELE